MDNNKLTSDQIKNWRKILFQTLGPYALIMSDEEVQRHKDKMQERINELSEELANA